MEAGMDTCLTKPVNGPFLLDRIDELTAGHMQVGAEPLTSPSRTVLASERGLIDAGMLENLRTLGGSTFLKDVISTFLVDGASILADMQEAVVQGDVAKFNERAHALQSGAGNIGVQGLVERCRLWRPKSADDLRANGPAVLDGIRSDFEAARTHFLRDYVSGPVLIFDPRQSDIH
jgi:two-component system sensor histidine kinase RpfC